SCRRSSASCAGIRWRKRILLSLGSIRARISSRAGSSDRGEIGESIPGSNFILDFVRLSGFSASCRGADEEGPAGGFFGRGLPVTPDRGSGGQAHCCCPGGNRSALGQFPE